MIFLVALLYTIKIIITNHVEVCCTCYECFDVMAYTTSHRNVFHASDQEDTVLCNGLVWLL